MYSDSQNFTCGQYSMQLLSTNYQQQKRLYLNQRVLFFQFTTTHLSEYPIISDGCIDLIFSCDSNKSFAYVAGTTLMPNSTYFLPYTEYFGVRLSPTLSTHIEKVPLKELLNKEIQFELIFPQYKYLIEQITATPQFEIRIKLFELACKSFLYREKNEMSLVDFCIENMMTLQSHMTIEQLSHITSYSSRHLRQQFDNTIGFSPKLLLRILRFQHTFESLQIASTPSSLSNLAQNLGYTDQSHFIKDFKNFSHFTPMQMSKMLHSESK